MFRQARLVRSTRDEIAHLVDAGDVPEEEADLVASGYETTCLHCEAPLRLVEVPRDDELVECPACNRRFRTALPEHAYG